MTEWRFFNPVRIQFGNGALKALPAVMSGGRPIVVTTPGSVRRLLHERVTRLLGAFPAPLVYGEVTANPEIEHVESAASEIRAGGGGDCIVAVGGGSALDFGKALSVLLVDPAFSLGGHFEKGMPLPTERPLPLHAVPTTAGTGSEVTPFATLWDGRAHSKRSLADVRLFAQNALLDPELTVSLPEDATIFTGLDALSQGLEAIWNRNATPVASGLAVGAVRGALRYLPQVVQRPRDLAARAGMLEASLLAGLAISSTRTALAHSMSYPLTARLGVPHGLACGFTLPALLRYNAAVDDGRLRDLAEALGLEGPEALAERLQLLVDVLEVGPRLRRYVPALDALVELAPDMLLPGRADNNLREAGVDSVVGILTTAWSDSAGASG